MRKVGSQTSALEDWRGGWRSRDRNLDGFPSLRNRQASPSAESNLRAEDDRRRAGGAASEAVPHVPLHLARGVCDLVVNQLAVGLWNSG